MSWVNTYQPDRNLCQKIYEAYTSNLRAEQVKANVKRGSYKRRIGEDR